MENKVAAIGFYCGTLVGIARVKGEIKADEPEKPDTPRLPPTEDK